jgi:hypothetical protein
MQDTTPTTATTALPYPPASQSLITLYHSPPKDLAGIFARYKNVVWRLGEDHSGPGMEAIAPSTILASEDGWIIRSSGRAPQLLLPAIASLSGRPLMLRAEITAPQDTELRVYYCRASQADYSLTRYAGGTLSAGHNVVYLNVDVPDLSGRLRFDPGRCAGEFYLHGLELRTPEPAPKGDIEDMPSTD